MTPKRTDVIVNSLIGTCVGALVFGFFATLWTTSQRLTEKQQAAIDSIDGVRAELKALSDVTSEHVAKLRTGIRRLEEALQSVSAGTPLGGNEFERGPPQSALSIQQSVRDEVYQAKERYKK